MEARPELEEAAHAGVAGGGAVGVSDEQLEERDEVVRIPFARGVRLAEAELAARRQAPEERGVVDLEADPRTGAEAARGATRQRHLEGAAVETLEGALQQSRCRALERAAAERSRFGADAHRRTLPSPGTNGGLWWNGTRFSQSRSASKWISVVTCSGCSG